MDMTKFREMFLSEAKEHLQKMNALLPLLGTDPKDRKNIDALFREIHSVKGMAASMQYERTSALTHQMEDLMSGCRRQGEIPESAFGPLQAGFDLLEGLIEDIEAHREERSIADFTLDEESPEVSAAGQPPALSSPTRPQINTFSVIVTFAADAVAPAARAMLALRELAGLGMIIDSQPTEEQLTRGAKLGELTVQVHSERSPAEIQRKLQAMSDVERVRVTTADRQVPSFVSRREDRVRSVRITTDLLDRFIDLTGELITNRYILQTALREERWQDLGLGLDDQVRLINTLHHHVLRSRMLPLETVTGRLPRLVRELCRTTGKKVSLRLEGQEIELDRTLIEGLSDPLMHLIRNAIDHGIETAGEIHVRASREQDQVVLEVADNGRGIDAAVIRRRAIEKELVSVAQAEAMRDADALQLICLPGFSTVDRVTEISGRGVGMDVVKSAMEHLGGSLSIESAPGRGTCFRLKLPLSVAIINLLLVECEGHRFGIPFTRLVRAEEIARTEIGSRGRQAVATIAGEEVPLLSLRKILGLPPVAPGKSVSVVVTEARRRRVALVVDRLVGQRQAFVKTLAFPLNHLPGVSGATILGDGSVIFIIDPQTMLAGRPGRPTGRKESSHDLPPADGRAA